MRAYLFLEIRRSLRDRQYLAVIVGWPVGAYLLFSAVFASTPATQGLPVNTALMVAMGTPGTALLPLPCSLRPAACPGRSP